MKKLVLYIYALVLFSVLGAGCKKSFLDENLKSAYAPENTLVDPLGFEAAIAGLQNTVRDQYEGDQGIIATMASGTDIARNGQATSAMVPYESYGQLNSQDVASAGFWRWGYKTVNSANQIIDAIESGSTTLTPDQKNGYIAEAKFFRAYAYNFMSSLYGGIPLVKHSLTAPKTDFVRAPADSVLNFIIADLNYAAVNLPDFSKLKAQGRINKSAASQLLALVYLRANKPDLAEAEAKKVIANGALRLINTRYGIKKDQPGDPFSDMFIYGNMRRNQGNAEAIWVIEQNYNIPGGFSPTDQRRRCWVPFYVNIPGMLIADSLGGRGIGRIRPTNWWTYDLYKKNDMRNSGFNIHRKFYYNDPTSPKYGKQVVVTGFDTIQNIYAHTTKWNYYTDQEPFGTITYKDRIQMRLGETYLLLAEAQFKQGKLSEAATSINVLRTRANADLVQAGDITMDLILDERARELTAEEDRRVTLMRTGTLFDRVQKYNPTSAGSIKAFNQLLPIPQAEIDLNKDAKLDQNTGY
ncbi:RagB/SusD family nutrient uptake outer membrane protein [Pedobacter nutrimenti]|uniref:RagB/SusD family nutrient uptake outer membrane protein n=1 Tax=Pedobacter nutrimenti TaxID=1241337 RepID=UPI0029317B4E|nr:RagB/SusD family nutrient uptake outer membrane protein [Pedobacter nutrimenti]